MTKTEEFEILLTRWEDDIRRDISLKRKAAVHVFGINMQEHQKSGVVFENTRIEIDGIIEGAHISMLCSVNRFHADPDYDEGDEILKVIHKLTDENYKWSMAVDELLFKFYRGKITMKELMTGIDEVTEDHD
ncbi:MAG: hypothetical protein J6P89_11670 [Oscillospiraceae bacterium]|nr:hypothetical protein [Oscillospiraceae bacterium]